MNKIIVVFFISSLALIACTPQAPEQDQSLPTPTKEESTAQVGSAARVNLADVDSGETTNDGEMVVIPAPRERGSEEKLIHFVSLDLSKRLGLDLSAVTLVESLPVTWADGGLGCPADGVVYTQAEVAGYKITLEVNGKEYTYHSNGLKSFILCDGNIPIPPLDE